MPDADGYRDHAVSKATAGGPDRCGVIVNGKPWVGLAGHADRGSPGHDTRVRTTMTEQTAEEAEAEAQGAAAMGTDVETYREREARHSDFQPVFYGNINDPESFSRPRTLWQQPDDDK